MEILRSVTRKRHMPGRTPEIELSDLVFGCQTATRGIDRILSAKGPAVDMAAVVLGASFALLGIGAAVFGW